jgi:DNA mismatch endonuclease (patch repair protein)
MSDVFTPEQRSAVMARVRAKDTAPECALRRALHAKGLRYRLHAQALPGKPDIVFPGARVAVFVHGCFWHGHDCARGSRRPKTNAAYWAAKIARNRSRDAANSEALRDAGWRVEIVWTCEIARKDQLGVAAERLAARIRDASS